MEAFSIPCTTCQARLRVRDESAIGQILTCPKCGSMVLVELPRSNPSSEPRTAPPPRSQTNSAPTSTTPAVSLRKQQRPPEPSEFADTVEDLALQVGSEDRENHLDAVFVNDLLNSSEVPAESAPSEFLLDATALAEPGIAQVAEAPVMPTDEWISPTTAKWRNHVLIGAAAMTGILLALGVFAWLKQDRSEPNLVATVSTVDGSSADVDGAHAGTDASSTDTDENPLVPAAIVAEGNTAPDSIPPITAADPSNTTLDVSPPTADAVQVPSAVDRNLSGTESSSSATTPPASFPGPDLAAPIEPAPSTGSLAETLRDFSAILRAPEPPVESESPVPDVAIEPPVAADTVMPEREILVERPEPRVVDVEVRLSDRLAGIELNGQPLAKFLRLMSDYSTIPITLDPDSLAWSKLTPASPIKLARQDATVAEVLTAALEPQGLHFVVDGNQLVVTRRPKDASGMRSVRLDVTDLVGNDSERLQSLGTLIAELVAPGSWSSRGGAGTIAFEGSTLVIEQQEPVLLDVLAFCEKLRVARTLPTRSPYDAALFRLDSRTKRAAEKLRQSVSLTYIRPALLERILDRLGEATTTHLLVDWRALDEEGWNPAAETQFTVADQPLSAALQSLLEPMALTYRVVDESVLQITTPVALQTRLEIEFYRLDGLPEDRTSDDLVSAAQTAIGPEHFAEQGGTGQLAIDKDSNCLLAALPQPQQVALEQWLDEQRAPSPGLTPTSTR